jgi:glycosyltransferase involved in cell wall biosynthesis
MRYSAKPRVLILADYFLPGFKAGGPIRSLANLVEHLGKEFEFRIITRDRDVGERSPYAETPRNRWQPAGKAEVLYLSPPRFLPGLLKSAIADWDCEAIYLNSFFSLVFATQTLILRKLGLLPRITVIVAPRGEFSPKALALKKHKKRAYLNFSTSLRLYHNVLWQASSSYEEEDIRRHFPNARVMIVPNIVNDNPNRVALPSKRPGKLRLVYISRISRKKNLAFALRSLARLPGDIEFGIYGPLEDLSYWRECERLIATLPENVRVHYGGSLRPDQVRQTLAQHHFFFLPTLGENFGHVIAESLLVGCPVLVSDQTPWRDLEGSHAGWDLSLDHPNSFERALASAVEMDQLTFDVWSAGARRIGASRLESDAVEKNRSLLRSAVRMRDTGDISEVLYENF